MSHFDLMLTIRKAHERGHADHGWLRSFHTFSFADYYDPKHMGWGPLRVINDDTVAGGGGFPSHGHRDMEILSYVIDGALAHQDSMGNGSVMRRGDVQRMSAGSGVVHSEFNASKTDPVHFLQIWIVPARPGLASGYEQVFFSDDDKAGVLRLVASPDGAAGSVRIQQDARLYASLLRSGEAVTHALAASRKGWLHIVEGEVFVNGHALTAGDGVAVGGEELLTISSPTRGEVLVFDLPA